MKKQDDILQIRINRQQKEAFLKVLRRRKTTLSVWVRKQIQELLDTNT